MGLWESLGFDTWTDGAKYEQENQKLYPWAGIASSEIPATEEINLSLKCQKE